MTLNCIDSLPLIVLSFGGKLPRNHVTAPVEAVTPGFGLSGGFRVSGLEVSGSRDSGQFRALGSLKFQEVSGSQLLRLREVLGAKGSGEFWALAFRRFRRFWAVSSCSIRRFQALGSR